jgi:UDP-N-acetylglucosamine:LPS N-acetylglucosamine transferase
MASAPRILAISSGGGHWAEMRRIMPAFHGMDVSFASTRPQYASDAHGRPYYHFSDFSRFNKRGALRAAIEIFRIVLIVRPQVVISTGSAPTLLALGFGRLLFGARTIWIDSIANVERLSNSGMLARYAADIWLTQWEHLATAKGPHYWGAVL